MADPGQLLRLADEMAGRAAEDEGFAGLAVLAAHAALESLVNQLGKEEIGSFNERARFLPKWHDLCERTLGKQLDAAPDLERLHALRDGVAGFSRPAGAPGPAFRGPSVGGTPGALGRDGTVGGRRGPPGGRGVP